MIKSCSRRVVVLRNIQSNIIEEAILVLKNGSNMDEKYFSDKSEAEKKRDFVIMKEAELIINSFGNTAKGLPGKVDLLKNPSRKWYLDLLINACLLIGIMLFMFLIFTAL